MSDSTKEFMDIVIQLEKEAIHERVSGKPDGKMNTGNKVKIDANIVNKLITLIEGRNFTNDN